MRGKGFGSLLFCLLLLSMPAWGLDADVQSAKEEGMRLYNIHHSTAALPYLEQAAEGGDVEAMYYMGEAERRQRMGSMTRAALNWYLKAADHGDPYAMLRLFQGGACVAGDHCPEGAEGWREKALAETLPKAENGDADAMLALYHIYSLLEDSGEGVEWLKKAAEAGSSEAQTRLSKNIINGQGWYFFGSSRQDAALEWLQLAAKKNYVPAIVELSEIFVEQGDFESAWKWGRLGGELGYVNLRNRVGWCYLNPEELEKMSVEGLCPVEQDKVKGWAILRAVVEEVDDRDAKGILEDNQGTLTSDQMREAERLSDELVGRQPELSDFIPRFGY